MKLHDLTILSGEEFISITDQWRREWERGVQVTVNPATPNAYFKPMYVIFLSEKFGLIQYISYTDLYCFRAPPYCRKSKKTSEFKL